MKYLGGKSRIAREIVEAMDVRGPWWEPFCGGLSVSVQLASRGTGVCSDAHPALIALYRAIASGWNPPETLTETEYVAARYLPDSDPLKAFAGFGCSFGGRYFAGYARPHVRQRNPVGAARHSCITSVEAVASSGSQIVCQSFFDAAPRAGLTVYCDPPYMGTTGYRVAFDSDAFWRRAREWANAGSRVFVSEYECPIDHEVAWSKAHRSSVARSAAARTVRTEKLFRILPAS